MGRLGSYLRELRESRGVSLEEIARTTRIGKGHLEALEADEFGALPAPVFVKGFVRAYCRELQVPDDEALRRFGEVLGHPGAADHPGQARAARRAGGHRSTLVVTAVLLVALAGAVVLLSGRPPAPGPADPLPATPAPAPVAGPPPPPPAGPPPAAPAVAAPPAASAAPAAAAGTAVTPPPGGAPVAGVRRLQVKALEPTWVRVQADGQAPEQGLLAPGTTREWTARERFLLTIGNAAGIELTLDGRRLPALGARGAVIRDLVLPEGAPAPGS
jgi:transcriptional regulator with XRE-family HTH domain